MHDRHRARFFIIASVAAMLVTAIYVFAVQTRWGQRLDAAAVRGRHVLSRRDIHVATQIHGTIDVASVLLLGAAIALVALFRRRRSVALVAGAVATTSFATTEILKHLLPRPSFGVVDLIGHSPSYPSGHTTIAMALGVGATLVAPTRWRTRVAGAAALFTSAIGCSVVATASHRPSDAIGAVVVVTGWTAVVSAVAVRTKMLTRRSRPVSQRMSRSMAVGAAALLGSSFLVAVATTIAIHYGQLTGIAFSRAFIGAASAITGATFACMAALLVALEDTEFGRPRPVRPNIEATEEPAIGR